jgi:hypothetical protein
MELRLFFLTFYEMGIKTKVNNDYKGAEIDSVYIFAHRKRTLQWMKIFHDV